MKFLTFYLLCLSFSFKTFAFQHHPTNQKLASPPFKKSKENHQLREISKAKITPIIDGKPKDKVWTQQPWYPINQTWIGAPPTPKDFSGRYKMTWTQNAIYVLAEITDDILIDIHEDPFQKWWDDDCVEIFIDPDNSGGEHQYNTNAFAYHIALDGNVIDMSAEKKPILYNEHVNSKKITHENHVTIWEFEIKLFSDQDAAFKNPLRLEKNKKIGFAIAYNDNDHSEERENFIGSVFVPGEDKNQGWINADIFGTIVLID